MSDADPGFGIYVHWPYCLSKCPYCDFNSHVRPRIEGTRWLNAMLREIERFAAETGGRRVTSIFFGGGTPSLMSPAATAAIVDRAAALWRFAEDIEITLEANPNSAEAARFAGFRAAGVNRLSLGVQSLDPVALKFLGRGHDRAEALAAIELAQRHFARTSFDLIYARPDQSVAAWLKELEEALALAADHLSLYQLTIETGTGFETAVRRGEFCIPGDDLAGALFEATRQRLEAAGMPAYEISNHARPGAESRHNLTYWRYGDYLGLGPGAHGRLTRDGVKHALRAIRAPEAWAASIEAGGDAIEEDVALTPAERRTEFLMMGLRLTEGIPPARFVEELGQTLDATLDRAVLAELIGAGYLRRDDDRLRATSDGLQRLDAILRALV